VMLSIKPLCTVFIGRDVKGDSTPPLRLKLAAGSYNFRCINRRKRILHRFRIRVEAGKVFQYKQILKPGKLMLRTKPWGTISAKGLGKIGKTGTLHKLYQGTYQLTLYKKGSTIPGPGMRKSMRVTIRPGETSRLVVRLR